LSVAELQAVADETYVEAWRNLPPNILNTEERQRVLDYRLAIGAAITRGDPEAVRVQAQAFAAFLQAATLTWEATREARIAAAREKALAGIVTTLPGRPLLGPWHGVDKPERGGSRNEP
jgi:hypothetical protein